MRYRYEAFVGCLDSFIRSLSCPAADRALHFLKLAVTAHALAELGMGGTDREQVRSWAWEDMVIAFQGLGYSHLTGTVIYLWSCIPQDKWNEGRSRLNEGVIAANMQTPKTVKRRYTSLHLTATVRTPDMGFDLPAIVPLFGAKAQDWAARNGLPLPELEAQLEEAAQEEASGPPKPVAQEKRAKKGRGGNSHLRLVEGSEVNE